MAVSAESTATASSPGTLTQTVTLNASTSAARACFVVRVRMRDIDQNAEDGECQVTFDGTNGWRLTAVADAPQTEVECRARCVSW